MVPGEQTSVDGFFKISSIEKDKKGLFGSLYSFELPIFIPFWGWKCSASNCMKQNVLGTFHTLWAVHFLKARSRAGVVEFSLRVNSYSAVIQNTYKPLSFGSPSDPLEDIEKWWVQPYSMIAWIKNSACEAPPMAKQWLQTVQVFSILIHHHLSIVI